MASYPLVIIGGGLSGIAAGIRFARFGQKVLILEKHALPGGLNSYYYRHGRLFETGLHAMTNFAQPGERHAPFNKLLRQLKLSRNKLSLHEQKISTILFPGGDELFFSNDFRLLKSEIAVRFPQVIDQFVKLVEHLDAFDPLTPKPFQSTRAYLSTALDDPLLIDMLLLPLMMYGNSREHDMDLSQFVILFRAVFQEGFFRPAGTIKDFLDLLLRHYGELGGEIRYKARVAALEKEDGQVRGIRLDSGEVISCDAVLSTAGYPNTLQLLGEEKQENITPYEGLMSFVETLYVLPAEARRELKKVNTIIFYNNHSRFDYQRPSTPIDSDMGVICFADEFQDMPKSDTMLLRVTNPANYDFWKKAGSAEYAAMKEEWQAKSYAATSKIIGNYRANIVYQDTFTPVTIERFTGKAQGAVYGSPIKIKDGRTPFANLFIAGTDQGYLGIIGAMLSGVTIVNQHILGKL